MGLVWEAGALESHSKASLGGHQQRRDIIRFECCRTEIGFEREKSEAGRAVGR